MNKAEIETLAANKGCLIATNGFLSTSRMREVAKFYGGSGKHLLRNIVINILFKTCSLDLGVMKLNRRGDIHAAIFELVIPSDLQSITFADI